MSYLVLDLQEDCLDNNANTINLLRKALVVAKKLNLNKFEKWINNEMVGYTSAELDIPEYRKIFGELRAFNPVRGWIPTIINSSEMQSLLTTRKIPNSVSSLQHLIAGDGDELYISYPGEIEVELGRMFGFETKYQLVVPKAYVEGILEEIKTIILNWTLELEKDGILGEQMRFSDKEKKKAIEKNYTVNNFYGDIMNSQIQQDVNNSKQEK